jgi:hypothetical protein
MNRSILYAIARHEDGAEMAADLLDPHTRGYLATLPLGEWRHEEIGIEWGALEFIAFAQLIFDLHPLAAILLYTAVDPKSFALLS